VFLKPVQLIKTPKRDFHLSKPFLCAQIFSLFADMYSINNVSVSFTGRTLYTSMSILINPGDKIGLIGDNGSGKTTLLKLIAGLQEPDTGEIIIPSDHKVGYLRQEINSSSSLSVMEETKKAFVELNKIKKEIENLNAQLAEREDHESDVYMGLAEKLSHANERFYLLDGLAQDSQAEKVLKGLGFEQDDFNRLVNEFSGGWRMRVELAKILLQKPDILLLDEPVNHLDIESIEWLETFLKSYHGALILVAHDRTFLDNVCSRTIELSNGKVYDYKMSYSKYVKEREERMVAEIAAYNNQQRQIRQIERFIERFRYKNTKARQVKSKQKELNKMDKVEIDIIDRSSIGFSFQEAPNSGKVVVEARALKKAYGDNLVLNNLDFVALKGEKIAFVGKNGTGKSTLLKIIVGEEDYSGELKLGYQVNLGYYAQNQTEMLDPNKTVFETIDEVAVGEIRKKIRDILGNFMFSGEDIDKYVKVLSGGEKSRLALAKMLLKPYNFLILDEPTNHLDLKSKDILKSALLMYSGTLIIVSHDRDFLTGLSTKTVEFRKGHIKNHIGDVQEFLEKRKINQLSDLNRAKKEALIKENKSDSRNKIDYLQRKDREKALRKVKNQIEKLENEIAGIESEIKIKDDQLSNPSQHKNTTNPEFFKSYDALKLQLEKKLNLWEVAHEEFEKLNAKIIND
jgi:ATP-binding cassette subfamily F protein 3